MTSRTSRFLWGAGLTYGNFALTTLVGLWLTRFLLGQVGADGLGLWVQLLQVAAFLTVLDLGVVALLPREVATATGRAGGWQGAADLPLVVGRFATLAAWQTPVVGLAAIAGWVAMTAAEPTAAGPLALILAGYTALFPFRVGPAILGGLQDARFLGLAQFAAFATGTAVTVGVTAAGGGLYGPAAGWVANQATLAALSWGRLWAVFRPVLPTRLPRVRWTVVRGMISVGAWASLASLGTLLVGNTDVLAIGRFHPAVEVLRYAFTAKLVVVLGSQVIALCGLVLPGMAEVRAAGDPARTARVLTAYAQAVMLFSGWVGCLVLAVNTGFVGLWVGPGYDLGVGVTGLMVLGMTLRHWGNCQSVGMFVAHRERVLWAVTLAEGLTAAGLIATLATVGPGWVPLGVIGASAGVFLPVAVATLDRSGYLPVRVQIRGLGWWAVRAAVVAGLVVTVRRVWSPTGLAELAVAGLAVTAVYAGLMLPAALRREVGEYLGPRLRAGWFVCRMVPSPARGPTMTS